jgi:hypothetical protein
MNFDECVKKNHRLLKLLDAQNTILLSGYKKRNETVHVIDDGAVANLYSYKQSMENASFFAAERYAQWLGDDFEYWIGLTEREAVESFANKTTLPQSKIEKLIAPLVWNHVTNRTDLTDVIPTLGEELEVTIQRCFYNESYDRPSALFSQILDVYEQGGWPCGWLGKYPDGKLIVLDPNPK